MKSHDDCITWTNIRGEKHKNYLKSQELIYIDKSFYYLWTLNTLSWHKFLSNGSDDTLKLIDKTTKLIKE